MLFSRATRHGFSSVLAAVLVACLAAPASAQEASTAPDPNPGNLTLHGKFRLPQHLHVPRYPPGRHEGDHVACSGSRDGSLFRRRWPEERRRKRRKLEQPAHRNRRQRRTEREVVVRGRLLRHARPSASAAASSLGTTYTAYTSPNNMFSTVKEIAFKLGVDDSAYLGRGALKPYALVAFELDTAAGLGSGGRR